MCSICCCLLENSVVKHFQSALLEILLFLFLHHQSFENGFFLINFKFLGTGRSYKKHGLVSMGMLKYRNIFFFNIELKMHCKLEHCLGEKLSHSSTDLVASFYHILST